MNTPTKALKSKTLRRAKIISSSLIVSLFLGLAALAQQNAWKLGPYELLVDRHSRPLQVTMSGARGLRSSAFVGSVGGIAFEAAAGPAPSLKGKDLKLSYDKSQKDGNRLTISIGSQTFHPSLPDWILLPVSKYADSPYTACVSLFGERTTESAYDIVYHPAFQDTLMGLRLLQADILLMDVDKFWDLPRLRGKVILGLGESMPNKRGSQSAALEVRSVFKRQEFQSWILTDYGVPVIFSVNRGAFTLTGQPYYYFWKPTYQKNSREPKITEVTSLTEGLKAKRGALSRLNPAVYGAVTKAMQFAALFKYVKRTKPANWTAFRRQLQGTTLRPAVKTPTTWKTSTTRKRSTERGR